MGSGLASRLARHGDRTTRRNLRQCQLETEAGDKSTCEGQGEELGRGEVAPRHLKSGCHAIAQTRVDSLTEVGTPSAVDVQDCEGVFVGTPIWREVRLRFFPPFHLRLPFPSVQCWPGRCKSRPPGLGNTDRNSNSCWGPRGRSDARVRSTSSNHHHNHHHHHNPSNTRTSFRRSRHRSCSCRRPAPPRGRSTSSNPNTRTSFRRSRPRSCSCRPAPPRGHCTARRGGSRSTHTRVRHRMGE